GRKDFLHAKEGGMIVRDQSAVNALLRNKRTISTMDALRTQVYEQVANTIANRTIATIASPCE
ncbi:MAG TPA: hypothetical protein VKG92_07365, partial [Flavobacteriales bacterium]|nr:hypothetical protein [Flavobacteriales bacterium]